MVSKKKAFFTKARHFINDMIPGVNDEDGRTPAERRQARKEWEQKRQKEHELLLKQKGVAKFVETVKNAKTVKVEIEKDWNLGQYEVCIWYIFGENDKYRIWDEMGVVYSNDFKEEKIELDDMLYDMIIERVRKLNPEDLAKAKQEKQKWDGKRYFLWPKKAFRESNR